MSFRRGGATLEADAFGLCRDVCCWCVCCVGVTASDPPRPCPLYVTVEAVPAADGKGGARGGAASPKKRSPKCLAAPMTETFLFIKTPFDTRIAPLR